ncbi:hypothetical protein Tco_1506639 [Tanacetum coccineum]
MDKASSSNLCSGVGTPPLDLDFGVVANASSVRPRALRGARKKLSAIEWVIARLLCGVWERAGYTRLLYACRGDMNAYS